MSVVGTQQSPIDIDAVSTYYSPCLSNAISIRYADKNAVGTFVDDNFVLDLDQPALKLVYRGQRYRLVKIHFHSDCEHLINNGKPAQFELHLVHQLMEGKKKLSTDKLVLAVYFDQAESSSRGTAFRQWGGSLVSQKASRPMANTSVETLPLSDFVPENLSRWFTYEGSLTTPPFSEDVKWIVVWSKETVNSADVQALIDGHAEQHVRPLQLLNRRYILRNFA